MLKEEKQPTKQCIAVYNTVKKRNEENAGKEQLDVRKAGPEQTLTLHSLRAQYHTQGATLKEFQVPYFNFLTW